MATALTIPLDERGSLSLQQQLYTRLRDDILARRLRPGERLPPSRLMAAQLAVSRTTIVLVYEQLVAEGYAEARQGAGTFVSRQIPDEALVAAPRPHLLRRSDERPSARLSADGQHDPDDNGVAADPSGPTEDRWLSTWGGRMADVHT